MHSRIPWQRSYGNFLWERKRVRSISLAGAYTGISWAATTRRYGMLVIYLAGLSGWMILVPHFGPVGAALAAERGVAFAHYPLWFLGGHGPGLVLAGIIWDRRPHLLPYGLRLAPVLAALFTLLIWRLPPAAWPLYFAAMGLVVAAGMTGWGRLYANTVEPPWLGRVFALAAAGASGIAGLLGLAVRFWPADTVLMATLLPLAACFVASQRLQEDAHPIFDRAPQPNPPQRIRTAAGFTLFLFFIYVVAGLSYRYLIISPLSADLDAILRVVPYIGGVLIAGLLAERHSLHTLAAAGAGLLAFSFVLGAWNGQPLAATASMALNGLAFGLLEPITWLLLAQLSSPSSAGRWFGWGLNLNVATIFIGAMIMLPANSLSPERLGLVVATAILIAIVALQLVSDLPHRAPVAPAPHLPADEQGATLAPPSNDPAPDEARLAMTVSGQLSVADLLGHTFGHLLSDRELEVGQLAILGLATREIAARLFLSENTVKTHLRNLYKKTGAANRNDLYRSLVEPDRHGSREG